MHGSTTNNEGAVHERKTSSSDGTRPHLHYPGARLEEDAPTIKNIVLARGTLGRIRSNFFVAARERDKCNFLATTFHAHSVACGIQSGQGRDKLSVPSNVTHDRRSRIS